MKTMQKNTVHTFTFLEILVMMSTMGIFILISNQNFITSNHVDFNFEISRDFMEKPSQVIDRISEELWLVYNNTQAKGKEAFVCKEEANIPDPFHLIFPVIPLDSDSEKKFCGPI